MVRRSVIPWIVLAALTAAGPASAAPVNWNGQSWTGKVETDFDMASDPNIVRITDRVGDVVQNRYMTDRGWTNGWDVSDIRFKYDEASDNLYVGVNFVGVAGDADGDGNPNGRNADFARAVAGKDTAMLGGSKSISLTFAPDAPGSSAAGPTAGTPVVIAGVPGGKNEGLVGIDQFTVASYKDDLYGRMFASYGSTLDANKGVVGFTPSKDMPDFVFNIKNFSQLLDPRKGIWVGLFAGAVDDNVAGEEAVFGRIPQLARQEVPEPATVLAWAAVVVGAAGYTRRRRAAGAR